MDHLIFLRLWSENDGGRVRWRGSVEHVGTRSRRHFADIGELAAHVVRRLAELSTGAAPAAGDDDRE
jgi:hypothetical protein